MAMTDDIEPQDVEEAEAEQAVSPESFIAWVTQSQNLAEELDDAQLSDIASQALDDYDMDKESMSDWLEQMQRGIDLANLVKTEKSYPFENPSNVAYPLVTSAALQFNARAYPAIVSPDRVVKAKVWGADKGGKKAARADRISEHMSWQLSAQIPEWEEETDKLLVQLPIVGEMVRKWWYDHSEGRPRCRLLDPGKFIVNDSVTSLSDAPRCTEELPLYPTEIETRKRTGQFIDFTYDKSDEDKQAAEDFIEQHTRIDLDEDGYDEPYVVTVHVDTRKVVRIVADYSEADVSYQKETRQTVQMMPMQDPVTGEPVAMEQLVPEEVVTGINSIKRGTYFIPFKFLPSMDGGYHGTGLGILLGDISDAINTIINMLIDAGHYSMLGGGFIGAEFRMKGAQARHRPGEWKMVQCNGQDVRQSLVPLPFPGPDGTLFSMLGMLIDAGREIASVQDVMTGDSGQKGVQTATTTLALIEQGMMVFTAAYKRIFRALKAEYALLARINRDTVDPQAYAAFHDMHAAEQQEQDPAQPQMPQQMGHNGGPPLDPRADYDDADMDIQPVADPRNVTKMQQAAKAQLIMQLADQGLVDRGEAMARVAEAMDIEDSEALMPKPDPMAQQMQQFQLQAAQADLTEKSVKIQLLMAQIEETRSAAVENMANAESGIIRAQNEQMKTRMDGLKTILEDERGRLEALLRSAGGMARQPGNGAPAQGNGPVGFAPQGGNVQIIPGGQPGPGGGSFGPFDGGGMG